MRWTVIRGASADGSVEWEEKFWETSDPYTYRELGAVKRGRDSDGQAWQESWKEMYQHDVNGTPFIHREASKWSHTPKGQCWSEGWTEDYRADGSVDRYCEKTGSLEDGAAPEDGHANRWTEKWGEKWNGVGGCIKWTDTWASRPRRGRGAAGYAPGRSWGEKWEEKWGCSFNDEGNFCGDEAGHDVGRARRRAHAKDVGGGALPGREDAQVREQLGREPVLGRVAGRGRGVVGTHAQLRVARSHRTLAVPHGGAAAAANRRGRGSGARGIEDVAIITPHRGSRRRVE